MSVLDSIRRAEPRALAYVFGSANSIPRVAARAERAVHLGDAPTWTTRAPLDRLVSNPNVAKGTVAPWSFLS
jgi:hypothetical protein